MENTELMVVSNQNLYVAPVVGIEEAKNKFEMVRKYTANCLTKDVDYGKVPGVSKPSLLKPGAEKICSLFGLTPKFVCVDKIMNWNGEGNPDGEPFFYFEYRCDLFRGGEFVASCDASCNSWEKKYRYRKGELVCPNCGKPLRKSKNNDGYYCWTKTGGCGATFASNDSAITSQKVGDVKNYDTAEQVNTFMKMAQKRAYVGATLIACNLSEYYTQDVEDMDRNSFIPEQPEYVEAEYTPVQQTQPQTVQQQPKPAQTKPQFDEIGFLKEWNEKVTVLVDGSQITLPTISLETACDIDTQNKDGSIVKMGKRGVGQLAGMWKAYKHRLSEPNVNRDDVLIRLSAVNRILTERKAAQEKLDNIQ